MTEHAQDTTPYEPLKYDKPQLTAYGSVGELTASGGSSLGEAIDVTLPFGP